MWISHVNGLTWVEDGPTCSTIGYFSYILVLIDSLLILYGGLCSWNCQYLTIPHCVCFIMSIVLHSLCLLVSHEYSHVIHWGFATFTSSAVNSVHLNDIRGVTKFANSLW